jgi:hypothetical protein
MKECFHDLLAIVLTTANILGVMSLIPWSVIKNRFLTVFAWRLSWMLSRSLTGRFLGKRGKKSSGGVSVLEE